MTREQLLDALNLGPGPSAGATEVLDIDGGLDLDNSGPVVPESETALKLDDWSLRRGREVLESSERLQGLYAGGEAGDKSAAKPVLEGGDAELATADFHAAAFEPDPQLAERCKNERIGRYMKNLMDTPEFQALHNETRLDETASEIAAAHFAEGYVKLHQQEQAAEEKAAEDHRQACEKAKAEGKPAPAAPAPGPDAAFKADGRALAAAAAAMDAAGEEVEDLRDAQNALGMGGHGGGDGQVDAGTLAKMFKKVKDSHALKRICELAGRYRRCAQAQQRQKAIHGQDDVVGVVLDGDIGRLIPSELAMIGSGDEDLELDALRRVVERQAMCREYRGVEKVAKGPIVVVVDESGSMGGEPVYNAKAMALALAWVAKSQNRWCCLIGFSGATDGNFLVIPPGKNDPVALTDWLTHFYGGGTDLDVPLDVLPKRWQEIGAPKGKTDIIVLTDACLSIPDALRKSFLDFKAREQVKLVTLVINGEPGDMTQVSDRVHCVKSVTLEEDAVVEALGV